MGGRRRRRRRRRGGRVGEGRREREKGPANWSIVTPVTAGENNE